MKSIFCIVAALAVISAAASLTLPAKARDQRQQKLVGLTSKIQDILIKLKNEASPIPADADYDEYVDVLVEVMDRFFGASFDNFDLILTVLTRIEDFDADALSEIKGIIADIDSKALQCFNDSGEVGYPDIPVKELAIQVKACFIYAMDVYNQAGKNMEAIVKTHSSELTPVIRLINADMDKKMSAALQPLTDFIDQLLPFLRSRSQ